MTLLVAKDYSGAEQALDKLVDDFPEHQDLPETLYWIAEGFRWGERYEKAKLIHEQIVRDFPDSLYAERAELAIARIGVFSLIYSRNYSQAREALDNMAVDFSEHPDLPETLYWIAEGYRWANKWEQAQEIFQKIIQDYPDSSYADRARVGQAKVQILTLIELRKFGPAESALNELVTNFEGHPDLPKALYWIGRGYEWESKYEEANHIHKQIANQYPGSAIDDEVRLSIARTDADLLIISGETEAAQAAVEKLKTDFAGHPKLAETLYEIAKVYDYADSMNEAYNLQSDIAADYPETEYGSKSSIHEARLAVYELIDSNDAEAADTAVEQMEVEFAGNEMLCAVLELIAEKYDRASLFSNAQAIYERIINNCSSEIEVMISAKAGLGKYELLSAIESGDTAQVDVMVSNMAGYFGGDCEKLSDYLNTLAIRCYSEGRWARLAGDTNGKAVNYFETAVMLWEKVFVECPDSPLAPAACISAAAQSAQELGDYNKAIDYFQKTCDEWPEYEHAAWAQLMVADYLEVMVQEGLIDAAAAKPLIIAALEAVIEKYPEDGLAKQVQSILEYYQQNEPGSRNPLQECK